MQSRTERQAIWRVSDSRSNGTVSNEGGQSDSADPPLSSIVPTLQKNFSPTISGALPAKALTCTHYIPPYTVQPDLNASTILLLLLIATSTIQTVHSHTPTTIQLGYSWLVTCRSYHNASGEKQLVTTSRQRPVSSLQQTFLLFMLIWPTTVATPANTHYQHISCHVTALGQPLGSLPLGLQSDHHAAFPPSTAISSHKSPDMILLMNTTCCVYSAYKGTPPYQCDCISRLTTQLPFPTIPDPGSQSKILSLHTHAHHRYHQHGHNSLPVHIAIPRCPELFPSNNSPLHDSHDYNAQSYMQLPTQSNAVSNCPAPSQHIWAPDLWLQAFIHHCLTRQLITKSRAPPQSRCLPEPSGQPCPTMYSMHAS